MDRSMKTKIGALLKEIKDGPRDLKKGGFKGVKKEGGPVRIKKSPPQGK